MYEMVRVKKVKLSIIPNVIPSGFFFPPVADEERTIGKSGQIQGARIVMRPEMKAKNKRMSI
jgi:hypothetical protein